MKTTLCLFSTSSISFWPLMGLCFFSTLMIPTFSRRSTHTWRTTTFRFVWSGQLWIISPLQVKRTPPWRFGFNLSLFLYLHDVFNFHVLNFSLSNLVYLLGSLDYLGEAISCHISHHEFFWSSLYLKDSWKRYQCPKGRCYLQLNEHVLHDNVQNKKTILGC